MQPQAPDPTADPSQDASLPDREDHATGPGSPEGEHIPLRQSLRILLGASRGFWLVNLVNFGDAVAYFGVLTLMTLFLAHDVGFSTHYSTVGVSLFTGLVTLFMALGAGTISDRLGSRRALSLALAVVLAGRVLLTLAPGLGPLVQVGAWGAIVIMGFGEGVIQPAMYAGVKEYTDARTATMGYALLYSIMNLGIFAGEMLSPLVRQVWAAEVEGRSVAEHPAAGITGVYWFFILVTAALLLANLLFFTRKVERRDRVAVPPPETPAEPEARGLGARLRSLPILDRRFIFFIFILLPVRTLFAHQWLTMPHYVTRAFPEQVGARFEWFAGINPFIIVIFVPLFAALTRKRHVVDMMIVGTAVSAVSTFLLVPAPSLPLLIGYTVIFSLGEAVWSSRFLEYVADLAPANRVGIYMGIAGLPWFIAKATTGLYAGSMVDAFVPASGPQDPGTLWFIYALVALISPVGLILARRWLLKGEHRAAA